jgi:hypothetical protein
MKHIPKVAARTVLLVIFIAILVLIVALARGYRFDLEDKTITSTGIISMNSAPEAAKIFVNGELRGVTKQNITLPPGEYDIRVSKDGFTEWQRRVRLKGEIVLDLEAVLFPKNPSLSPLTSMGVAKAIPVGQSNRVLVFSTNGDVEKDGIYMLDGNSRRLSLVSPLKLIVLSSLLPQGIDFKNTDVEFSPDFSQGIFTFVGPDAIEYSYLLSLENTNTEPFEVTASRDSILVAWDREKKRDLQKLVETFPPEVERVATDSFRIIAMSPDETKILYRAVKAAEIPLVIDPPLIGSNQTEEKRTLVEGEVYVYDRKEDKNFRIQVDLGRLDAQEATPEPVLEPETVEAVEEDPEATDTPSIDAADYLSSEVFDYIQWYPSSRHLVLNEGETISVVQYDGTNKQSVYSGPFEPEFFGLNDDWKLLILANLNPRNNPYGDVYEVGIR